MPVAPASARIRHDQALRAPQTANGTMKTMYRPATRTSRSRHVRGTGHVPANRCASSTPPTRKSRRGLTHPQAPGHHPSLGDQHPQEAQAVQPAST
jgi:hypothetical protein